MANQNSTLPLFGLRRTGARHPLWPFNLIHPEFRELGPPVIVVGAPRSGVGLCGQVLQGLGIYVGPPTNAPTRVSRGESRQTAGVDATFAATNDAVLDLADAVWNRPAAFPSRRREPEFRDGAIRVLAAATHRELRAEYLHPRGRQGLNGTWGWCDPRNSLTLSLWLTLFPAARVIHVRRNIDCMVRSLQGAACTATYGGRRGSGRSQGAYGSARSAPKPSSVQQMLTTLGLTKPAEPAQDPCLNGEYARFLCQEYERECLSARGSGGGFLEVRFEELLSRPVEAADRLRSFLGA